MFNDANAGSYGTFSPNYVNASHNFEVQRPSDNLQKFVYEGDLKVTKNVTASNDVSFRVNQYGTGKNGNNELDWVAIRKVIDVEPGFQSAGTGGPISADYSNPLALLASASSTDLGSVEELVESLNAVTADPVVSTSSNPKILMDTEPIAEVATKTETVSSSTRSIEIERSPKDVRRLYEEAELQGLSFKEAVRPGDSFKFSAASTTDQYYVFQPDERDIKPRQKPAKDKRFKDRLDKVSKQVLKAEQKAEKREAAKAEKKQHKTGLIDGLKSSLRSMWNWGLSFFSPDQAHASTWADNSYNYRNKITLTGSSGAGNDYQVLLKIGTDSSATGADFDLNGNAAHFPAGQDDGGDLRFFGSDDTTPLDFWVEKVENNTAYVWIEVADNLDTNKEIYVYYGNNTPVNYSDGEGTFIFFDDFSVGSLDTAKWQDDVGHTTVSGGELTLSANANNVVRRLNTVDNWNIPVTVVLNTSVTTSPAGGANYEQNRVRLTPTDGLYDDEHSLSAINSPNNPLLILRSRKHAATGQLHQVLDAGSTVPFGQYAEWRLDRLDQETLDFYLDGSQLPQAKYSGVQVNNFHIELNAYEGHMNVLDVVMMKLRTSGVGYGSDDFFFILCGSG